MGSKAQQSGPAPKRRRRGRKLLVLGLIGLGTAAVKAMRDSSSSAPAAPRTPTPTQAPAAPPVAPVAPAAHAHPVDVSSEPDPIEQLETESADIPGLADEDPDDLVDAVDAASPVEAPVPATEDLHDIVEEPWADAEVTPVTEPPADSLSSFFDEIMTDTADRKLRNGQ